MYSPKKAQVHVLWLNSYFCLKEKIILNYTNYYIPYLVFIPIVPNLYLVNF